MTDQLKCLVTGVASGIGRSIHQALVAKNHLVFGVDYQAGSSWMRADLSLATSRSAVVEAALKELGSIDVLINVAGIFHLTPFGSSGPSDWREVWDVNLEAPLELMSLCFDSMKAQGFGRVVNITSVHAGASRVDCLAYDVGKAGLEAATRSLALSGAAHGILANAVAPGFVRTAMSLNDAGVDEADTEQFRAEYVATGRLPLGRPAYPEEVAEAVLWLASRENTYTTGQTLVVDGGLTATF